MKKWILSLFNRLLPKETTHVADVMSKKWTGIDATSNTVKYCTNTKPAIPVYPTKKTWTPTDNETTNFAAKGVLRSTYSTTDCMSSTDSSSTSSRSTGNCNE